jgi:CBS domain containing-hemolysin-like protein
MTDPGTANDSGRSGDPIGYVHLKDVLRASDSQADAPVPAKRIHHIVPVNMTTDLEDALALMRQLGRHLARVRANDGRTVAVLFLEDVLEELIGEAHDATERSRRR